MTKYKVARKPVTRGILKCVNLAVMQAKTAFSRLITTMWSHCGEYIDVLFIFNFCTHMQNASQPAVIRQQWMCRLFPPVTHPLTFAKFFPHPSCTPYNPLSFQAHPGHTSIEGFASFFAPEDRLGAWNSELWNDHVKLSEFYAYPSWFFFLFAFFFFFLPGVAQH